MKLKAKISLEKVFEKEYKIKLVEPENNKEAEIMNTPDNLAKNWVERTSIDKSTNEPKTISELGLEVQSHNFYSPNRYEFLCNSSKNYVGGQLTFTADNFDIFNKDNIGVMDKNGGLLW